MNNSTPRSYLAHGLSIVFLVVLLPFANAEGIPTICIDDNLLVLTPETVEAITNLSAYPPELEDLEVIFSPIPTQLVGLTIGRRLVAEPTTEFPVGLSGTVLEVDATDPNSLVIIMSRSRLPGNEEVTELPAGLNIFTPLGSGEDPCLSSEPGLDSDGDGSPDSGSVAGTCTNSNGGDIGFSYALSEGVVINGLLTLAPLDMEAAMSISSNELNSFSLTNKSRISFTGEITAQNDATFENKVYNLATIPVGSYSLNIGGAASATIDIEAQVFVGLCGSMTAGAHAGITSTTSSEFGYEYLMGQGGSISAEPAERELNISPPELDSDTQANLTFYGGAELKAKVSFTGFSVVPVAGTTATLTALAATSVDVVPAGDPWWQISGQPEIYLTFGNELLGVDLEEFNFSLVTPPPQVFFDSNSEFPFSPPAARNADRGADERESGSALRWSRAFLSDTEYDMKDAIATNDGGTLMVANTAQLGGVVIRTNYLGDRIWQKSLVGNFITDSVAQLPDGGFLIAGFNGSSIWLLSLDVNGNERWIRQYSSADLGIFSQSAEIASVDNNGYTLAGQFILTDGGDIFHPWAARIDNDGNVVWANHYGVPGVQQLVRGVSGTSDGGAFLVGQTEYTPAGPVITGANTYALRVLPDGAVGWSHVYAGPTIESFYAGAQAADGSYIAVGEHSGLTNNSIPRGLVVRFDQDPQAPDTVSHRYVTTFSGSRIPSDTFFDKILAVTPQGDGFVFAGTSLIGVDTKVWMARMVERNNRPDLVWSTFTDGLDRDDVEIVTDMGDGLLLGGDSLSFPLNGEDNALWVTRVPYEGFLNWNAQAQTTTHYTPMVQGTPPGNIIPALAETAEEDLTLQEQTIALTVVMEDVSDFDMVASAFTQVELMKEPLAFGDFDLDGFDDSVDNCTNIANDDQIDTDGDGFGNACDTDFNNDCIVNFLDIGAFSNEFLGDNPLFDTNGDGFVNFIDYVVVSNSFLQPPGPGFGACE